MATKKTGRKIMDDWKTREDRRKKMMKEKTRALQMVGDALEALYHYSEDPDHGFVAVERKVIAEASYRIRSVSGGWVLRGRR